MSRYRFIREKKADYPLAALCRAVPQGEIVVPAVLHAVRLTMLPLSPGSYPQVTLQWSPLDSTLFGSVWNHRVRRSRSSYRKPWKKSLWKS